MWHGVKLHEGIGRVQGQLVRAGLGVSHGPLDPTHIFLAPHFDDFAVRANNPPTVLLRTASTQPVDCTDLFPVSLILHRERCRTS